MRISRTVVIAALVAGLLVPAAVGAKRPEGREPLYVTDVIRKAQEQEEAGRVSDAEHTLLELLESVKSDRFREEYEWLSYMSVLRNLISFYYRQGDYKEADWYHREYSHELEGDRDESGMQAAIVFDIKEMAEGFIEKGRYRKAEDMFLYLKDRLEDRFGYEHWLVRLVYKNIVGLYLQMGNAEMAEKYRLQLNPEESTGNRE